jgi:MscS family membrane protein
MASFGDFWELVRDVWQNGVWGIDLAHFIVALLVFFVFMTLRNLFTRFVLGVLKRGAERTHTRLDQRILDAVYEPVRFVPVVMGVFFASSVLDVTEGTRAFFYNLNRSLIAFTLFWALFRLSTPAGKLLMKAHGVLTQAMIEWIMKATRIAFVALGAATILEMWGIAVGPIIAGLGLFGVAIALGAQDLFKNLIAGMFVIGERRFFAGDWIQVDGVVEGTVKQIGFRTTTVTRFDRAPVYVPNARLADNAVTNFSRMSHRRIRWVVGLEYRTTLEQLKRIRDGIERYILETEAFADPGEAPTFVRVDSFNDSSIDLLVYCFTRTTVWGDWLEIKEQLAYRIKEIVTEAGAGFAFPSRSLYLETLPDAPELFPLSPPRTEA